MLCPLSYWGNRALKSIAAAPPPDPYVATARSPRRNAVSYHRPAIGQRRHSARKEPEMAETGKLRNAYHELRAGRISRRAFLRRATALGVATPVALGILQLIDVAAREATPESETVAAPPSVGAEGQTRGSGGELRILQWQAPTTLNMHLAGSFKDQLASCLVTEPLIHFLPDATPIPCLVKEVPSQANGVVSPDLMSVTYNLLEGIVWSDGEPFTTDDVVFTWQWITDRANQSSNAALYAAIASVEAVDDLTVTIDFVEPQLGWNSYFSSAQSGGILPKHLLSDGADANANFAVKPIGTGPYVVDAFAPNDAVQYSINDNYREPNKPCFAKVNLKGGGDATSAARAVLQTGDWDFAWNLQVDPLVFEGLLEGVQGDLVIIPGTAVEFIALNFSNPNKAELFIQMNDILIEDVVVIPIVQRASEKFGIAKDLNKETIAGGPFESLYWNIANWNRVS
jgi:peptide/nickel transport system substrate-binding protein